MTSLKPPRRQTVISSFVTSYQTNIVSFLYKTYLHSAKTLYTAYYMYVIIQISIFVISISLSFFCLCLANRFDITLMICFRTIIIALNSYLTTKSKLNLSISGISGNWRVRSGDISPKIFPGFTNGFKMTETLEFIRQFK